MSWVYGQQIWDALKAQINNEYGVAGLMGNLISESGLIPYRLQSDFSDEYTVSMTYTINVDNGTTSKDTFVHDAKGYGLAQWTYYTRKEALYNMKESMGVSIGNIDLGIAYLLYELNNSYPTVLNTLKNATSIRQASDCVLHDFENPEVQDVTVEIARCEQGQNVYDTYTGSQPPTPTPTTTHKMPLWMMCRR
jgi:hypothetical protein